MITELFPTFTLQLGKLKNKISDDEYFELCQINECLVIERNKDSDFEIKTINGGSDSLRNSNLNFQIATWAKETGNGVCFSAFTGFTLPNGAVRASDFAWLSSEKWNKLKDEEKEKFASVCPDFIVEIKGWHEDLKTLQDKMKEYIENGASLGWLIDSKKQTVYVYCPNEEVGILENPTEVSGEPLLQSFTLILKEIWE